MERKSLGFFFFLLVILLASRMKRFRAEEMVEPIEASLINWKPIIPPLRPPSPWKPPKSWKPPKPTCTFKRACKNISCALACKKEGNAVGKCTVLHRCTCCERF